jgi:hypothetical protein
MVKASGATMLMGHIAEGRGWVQGTQEIWPFKGNAASFVPTGAAEGSL